MDPLPFIPYQVYHRRQDIHAHYGGNWQSGISASATAPYIFIFTGKSGHQHGYRDGWDNDVIFTYTGEGQSGDMKFTKGNLALKDHLQNGKRVFLFESVRKGFVKFICEVEIDDFDFFLTHDSKGSDRVGIKFFFKKAGAILPYHPVNLANEQLLAEPTAIYERSLPGITEKEGIVTSRVGQGAYRKRIIHRWEYRCAVTGFNKLDLLVASHIHPWAKANDIERLDRDNGILLSPTFDALFDRHYSSFENSGKIILSEAIEKQAFDKIGVTGNERIKSLNHYNFHYLDLHRNHLQGK